MKKDFFGDFSLYIHIPYCVSKCAYCDFLSFSDQSSKEDYFDALCAEIRKMGRKYPREVNNVYFGGGTPSVSASFFPKLKEALFSSFDVRADAEISMECNPESVTEDFVKAAEDLGVNRVSLGVQSLSDTLLRRIGRVHDRKQALRALDLLTKSFSRVNADMMVGLPGETEKDVSEILRVFLDKGLSHVSCYSLILERGTRLYREAKKGLFTPDEDHAVEMYDMACAALSEGGLSRYEISNFAREGEECRYNLSVWQYADYLGLGLGASSFLKVSDPFILRRYREPVDLRKYLEGKRPGSVRISLSEGKEEFVMLGLRTAQGLSVPRFNALFKTDFLSEYAERLDRLRPYLTISEDFVAVKPEHFYISNAIISELI